MIEGRSALAYKILLFGMLFVVGAMLIAVLDPAMTSVLDQHQNMTSTQAAQTGGQWVEQAWDAAPFLVGILGVIMIIASAQFEQRGGPR